MVQVWSSRAAGEASVVSRTQPAGAVDGEGTSLPLELVASLERGAADSLAGGEACGEHATWSTATAARASQERAVTPAR
jgi:hypothetical protein